MSDLAIRWFIPLELRILSRMSILSCALLLVVLLFDYLRGDYDSMFIHWLGMLALSVMILTSIDHAEEGRTKRRNMGLITSGITLACGATGLFIRGQEYLLIDLWAALVLLIPGLSGLYLLSAPVVSRWVDSTLERAEAEVGLARNRRILPKWQMALKHVVLLHVVAVVIIPVLWIIDVAISPGDALQGGTLFSNPTGDHFSNILGGENFWRWARNSVIVSIGTTILGLCLAIPAGYAFSRYRFKGRGAMMFTFLLVQMFPGIIILVPYFMVMKSLGLLNTAIGLILAYSVTALPLCVWMLKGFFDTVPKELEEAALLDGCSQFGVFYRIILPLSLPAIAVTALFSFLAAWNEFLLALTFNTSDEMFTLPVGLASYISATDAAWGDFAAMSLLVAIPVVLLFIVFQKFLIEGLTAGSVKG